jgi:cellulose synthase/poly-beta-1,6-N-acetylglucosamine synthase-like glycosyltransferase
MPVLAEIFSILIIVLLLFVTLAFLYLLILTLAVWLGRMYILQENPPRLRFAILIPAHNEEKVLTRCLDSIRNLNYEERLCETFVIADNCSDKTVEVAKRYKVGILERTDVVNRGKGYALAWGLGRVNLSDYDAVVIVDADCILQENLLLAFNGRLQAGQKVLQARVGIFNRKQSFLTYLLYLGNLMENFLFYGGREKLGLSSFLRGTGMCFSTEILRRHNWGGFSETEDLEFSLKLMEEGTRISFVPETGVLAIQPAGLQTAYTQKRRWAGGTFSVIKKHFLRLLYNGLKPGKFCLIEAAFSLLLLSRPLLIYLNLLGIFLTLLALPTKGYALLLWGLILLMAQTLYLSSSIFLSQEKGRALKTLILAPFYLFWLLLVQLSSLKGSRTWQKTARENVPA